MDFTSSTIMHELSAVDETHISKIHIHIQQMGKKWITSIHGLDEDLDLKRIAKAMKRSLHCAASVEGASEKEKSKDKESDDSDSDNPQYIKLQGNHKEAIRDWLVSNEVLTKKEADARLVFHGI